MAKKSISTAGSPEGWLKVLLVSNKELRELGDTISIPEYLQVEHEGTRVNFPKTKLFPRAIVNGRVSGTRYEYDKTPPDRMYHSFSDPEGQEREFCTILEGPHRGKRIAALALKNGGRFHSLTESPPVYFIFTLGSKVIGKHIYGTLQYGGPTETVSAFTSARNIVPAREYDLQLPDAPHQWGRDYAGMCDSPMTWFRIGDSDSSRYLHPGMASDGCVTIPPGEWNQVFSRLRTARRGDGINVGKIKVIHSR